MAHLRPRIDINRIYSQDNSYYYLQATKYDEAGRITWRALGANNLAENPKLTNAFSYYAWNNQGGRLQSLQTYTTTATLQNLSYTYDNMGNVLTILDAQNSNQKQCFTYDSLNRLTKGTTSNDSAKGCTTQLGNGNYDEDYTYDSATGNLLSKTGVGTYTYSTSHSHAVASTSGNNWSFSYDNNGSMTQRNVGTTYNYAYNAENKLTEVSGGTTASFSYDGDGNRVKTVVGGTTTVFLGNYYEWTSSTVKKYYFAGSTRIAMRENSTLIFLSGDHLGSTSLVYKTDTGLIIKKLYKPWGETRYTSTTMPTKYQFTGQYREVSLGGADGLYYFVARWYDQTLGRFQQADTIVPQPGDVQAWDRYAYALNNPLKYIDPTGHWYCPSKTTGAKCINDNPDPIIRIGTLSPLGSDPYVIHPGQTINVTQPLGGTTTTVKGITINLTPTQPTTFFIDWGGVIYPIRKSIDPTDPDYYVFTLNGGSAGGVTFVIIMDRYGNWYFGVGGNAGKSVSFGSFSFSMGWIGSKDDIFYPASLDLEKFLTGLTFTGSFGIIGGGGITWSPLSHIDQIAWEEGVYTPQIGISGVITFEIINVTP